MQITKKGRHKNGISCDQCPLRKLSLFKDFSTHTLEFMKKFKVGELSVSAGTPLLSEGSSTPQVYTALNGMGLRYKNLENGNRQVLNFILPGDFIGLQAAVMGEMQHSVEATTEMTLCVFDRSSLWDLFKHEPDRAFDLTWAAAVEEHFLGDTLAALGQRTGRDRMGWALLRLHTHLTALGLREGDSVPFPYRQQDLADALGFSLVHTNKILSALRSQNLVEWSDGRLTIPHPKRLKNLAPMDAGAVPTRPLI